VLSGNKGRVLRASNSMATWKRRRPDHRSAGAASTDAPSGPASTCYCPCRAVHRIHTDDTRRPETPVVRVLGDGPSARTK
jgi:hypothetical protein